MPVCMPDEIRTARLVLRPFRDTDVDDVMTYATDEAWGRFLPVPQPYGRADAERFLAAEAASDRAQQPSWAAVLEGRVVGGINLRISAEHRLAEIGYALARRVWGQGLATEAAQAVVDTAFRTLPDLNRIRAVADSRNVASLRLLAGLGMRREGVLRQNRVLRGAVVDEVWCGILRHEWAAHARSAAAVEAVQVAHESNDR
jgi:[ribosomal protein S5]-alanine N-acetyltransferase